MSEDKGESEVKDKGEHMDEGESEDKGNCKNKRWARVRKRTIHERWKGHD